MSNTRARPGVRAPDSELDSQPDFEQSQAEPPPLSQSQTDSLSKTRSSDRPPAALCLTTRPKASLMNWNCLKSARQKRCQRRATAPTLAALREIVNLKC